MTFVGVWILHKMCMTNDAKGNRRFDRYHGRGLRRARTETELLVMAQNLLRLDRIQRDAKPP